MARPPIRPLSVLLSLACAAALAACGGGGGDGVGEREAPAFEGTYQVAGQILGDVTLAGTVRPEAEGTTLHDLRITGANGVILSDFEPVFDPATGALDAQYAGQDFVGALGGAGELGVIVNDVGGQAGLLVLGRRGGTLQSAYRLVSLESDGAQLTSSHGRITFSPAGEATLDGRALNVDGTAAKEILPSNGSFQVDAEGALEIQLDNGFELTGGVVTPGDVGILSLDLRDGRRGTFLILAENGAASDATLSGDYLGAAFVPDVDDPVAFLGPVEADGAGTISLDLRNQESGDLPVAPDVLPYTVQPGGELTVEAGGGNVLRGAVSPDGRLAAVVSIAGGMSPRLFVFVRR